MSSIDPKDELKKVHEHLSKKYNVGSIAELSETLKDQASRKKVFDYLSEDYNVGDFNTFSGRIGYTDTNPPNELNSPPQIDSFADQLFRDEKKRQNAETLIDTEYPSPYSNEIILQKEERINNEINRANASRKGGIYSELTLTGEIKNPEPQGGLFDVPESTKPAYKQPTIPIERKWDMQIVPGKDNTYSVIPTLFDNENGDLDSAKDNINEAYNIAEKRGEVYKFDDIDDAKNFFYKTKKEEIINGYKKDLQQKSERNNLVLKNLYGKERAWNENLMNIGLSEGIIANVNQYFDIDRPKFSVEEKLTKLRSTNFDNELYTMYSKIYPQGNFNRGTIADFVKSKIGEDEYNKQRNEYEKDKIKRENELFTEKREYERRKQYINTNSIDDTDKITDFKTFRKWFSQATGNMAAQLPESVATAGMNIFNQEKNDAIWSSIKDVANKNQVSEEEVYNSDKFHDIEKNGEIVGLANMILEDIGMALSGVGGKAFGKLSTSVYRWVKTSGIVKYGISPIIAASGEGLTEGLQGFNTLLANKMANGATDLSDAVSRITDEEVHNLLEQTYSGAAGGIGMGVGSMALGGGANSVVNKDIDIADAGRNALNDMRHTKWDYGITKSGEQYILDQKIEKLGNEIPFTEREQLIARENGIELNKESTRKSLVEALKFKKKEFAVDDKAIKDDTSSQETSKKSSENTDFEIKTETGEESNNSEQTESTTPLKGDVNDAEYDDFINNGKVSDERLNDIVNKYKNREQLSDRENEIFKNKNSEIIKILVQKAEKDAVSNRSSIDRIAKELDGIDHNINILEQTTPTEKRFIFPNKKGSIIVSEKKNGKYEVLSFDEYSEITNGYPLGVSKLFDNKQDAENYAISEAYHKSKEDGSNPKLVIDVEKLLSNKQEAVEVSNNSDNAERSLESIKSDIAEIRNTIKKIKIDNPKDYNKDGSPKAKGKSINAYNKLVQKSHELLKTTNKTFQDEIARQESIDSEISKEEYNDLHEIQQNVSEQYISEQSGLQDESTHDTIEKIYAKVDNNKTPTQNEINYVNKNSYIPEGYIFSKRGLEKQSPKNENKTVEKQVKDFGISDEMVKPVTSVIGKVFEGLKKVGLTMANTIEDWLDIGNGGKSYSESLKQIIGEVGAHNLPKVKDNLQIARDMEVAGKTPKEIYLATGWERSINKGEKWKYDLPDIEFSKETKNNFEKGVNPKLGVKVYLSSVVDLGELAVAYPQLNDVKIEFVDMGNRESNGEWNSKTNIISVNRLITESQVKSTIIHEIQHVIQSIEGFAKGGNVAMFTKSRDNIQRLFKDIGNAFDKLGYEDWLVNGGVIDNTPNRNFNGMYSFAETKDKVTRDKMVAKLDEANKIINENKSIFGKNNTYDNINDIELYKRLAGEVESRNAEKRSKMTPEERKEKMISETEDIEEDSKIYIYGDDSVKNSIDQYEAEISYIKDKAQADGTFMKAPNGKPTNLNEKQWLQVRTKAFKDWFGAWDTDPKNASKVKDSNGEPMVVYHGTDTKFNKFDNKKTNDTLFWFTSNLDDIKSGAAGAKSSKIIMPLFLNIKKNAGWNEYEPLTIQQIIDKKYDGVILDDYQIAFSPNQIKSAIGNVGTFSPKSNNILYQTDKQEQFLDVINGFYSPLEKIISETKFDKLPAKQWIDKFAKGEEAKWTGLTDWLSKQQGSVSKSDIQQYLKDNRIEIKDVVKSQNEKQPDWIEENGIITNGSFNIEIEKNINGLYILTTSNGGWRGGFDTIEEAKNYVKDEQDIDTTKFSKYQLEGDKENYKEVLVTLPPKQERIPMSSIKEGVEYERKGYYIETDNNGKDFAVKNPSKFKSSHFDEPNILVHLRMNTRTDAEGNKVLFIEEFQRDVEKETDLGEKEAGLPFSKTTDYVKLAWKVALKEAVKQGATKIAWTTEEQQNDRYDLSKQVDNINYYKNEDGTYRVYAMKNGGTVFTENSLSESQLEPSFGKDVAQKIINNDGIKVEGFKGKRLEGNNLKVGGKGMKGFYGSPAEGSLGIVGNVSNSLFKQEPKTVEILIGGKYTQQHSIDITHELKAQVEEQGLPLFQKGKESKANAQYRIQAGKNIIEALKNFNGSPKAVTAITHEVMHPTVVAIIDGAKDGNKAGIKHTNTIVDEYNKANPESKITVEQLIQDNEAFKIGKLSEQYREVQEFIATAWEKYHTEGGKGFSKAFQEVLEIIKEAFRSVYKSFSSEQEISPQLRQMFDEILGKEDEIIPKDDVHGIKKELVPKETEEVPHVRRTDKEWIDFAKDPTQEHESPEYLIDGILDGTRSAALDELQVALLIVHKTRLDKELQFVIKKEKEGKEDMSDRKKVILSKIKQFNQVATLTALVQGRAFSLRKTLLNSAFDIVTQIRIFEANNFGEIDQQTIKKFEELQNIINEQELKIEQYEKENEKYKLQQYLNDISSQQPKKSKALSENTHKEIDRAFDEFEKSLGLDNKTVNSSIDFGLSRLAIKGSIQIVRQSLHAGLNIYDSIKKAIEWIKSQEKTENFNEDAYYNAIRSAYKIAKRNPKTNRIVIHESSVKHILNTKNVYNEDKTVDVDLFLSELHKDVIVDIPNATEEEVRDSFSGYGFTTKLSQEEYDVNKRKLKRAAKYISQLYDIQVRGIRPKKSGREKEQLTLEEIKKQKEIRTLTNGIVDETTSEKKEIAYLSKLKESIGDLENRIENLDLSYKEKKAPPTNEEIRKEKEKKKLLNEQLQKLRDEHGVTAKRLQKLKLQSLEKSIKDIKEAIKNGGVVPKKKKVEYPTTKKIEEAKKKRLLAIEELEHIQEKNRLNNRSTIEKIGETLEDIVFSSTKLAQAGLDLSAILRQGKFLLASHPIKWANASYKSILMAAKNGYYEDYMASVKVSDLYYEMNQIKLFLADNDSVLNAQEINFVPRFFKAIPLIGKSWKINGKEIPIGLDLGGRSNRAYSGFLNVMRVTMYEQLSKKLKEQGKTLENNLDEFKRLGDFINNATGRGKITKLLKLDQSVETLNLLMFSARFTASRINLNNPYYWAKTYKESPAVFHELAKSWIMDNCLTVIIGLCFEALGDDDDEIRFDLDPRSVDFEKLRSKNRTYDISGGMGNTIRLLANIATTTKTTAYGKEYSVNILDALQSYARSKLSPTFGATINVLLGSDFSGKPTNVQTELSRLWIPLIYKDISESNEEDMFNLITTVALPSILGIGIQEYDSTGMRDLGYSVEAFNKLVHCGAYIKPPKFSQEYVINGKKRQLTFDEYKKYVTLSQTYIHDLIKSSLNDSDILNYDNNQLYIHINKYIEKGRKQARHELFNNFTETQ